MSDDLSVEKSKKIDSINKRSLKPIKVRFCPNCKSSQVGFVFRFKNLFGLLPRIECYDCGHFGQTFPIVVTSEKEIDSADSVGKGGIQGGGTNGGKIKGAKDKKKTGKGGKRKSGKVGNKKSSKNVKSKKKASSNAKRSSKRSKSKMKKRSSK